MAGGSQMAQAVSFDTGLGVVRPDQSGSGLPLALPSAGEDRSLRPQSMLETPSIEQLRQLDSNALKSQQTVGFNEVSAALDTLRSFLRQKDVSGSSPQHLRNSSKGSPATRTEQPDLSSPQPATSEPAAIKPIRTLRRSKGGILLRNLSSDVDEFGSLQLSQPPPASISSPSSGEAFHLDQAQKHSMTESGKNHGPPMFGTSRQDDRLAVLEDLSERVSLLKAQTEREKEEKAAASMPPPSGRPLSLRHRSQSSMTRREMHEEYLRKRRDAI
jgi:hypothetical protein